MSDFLSQDTPIPQKVYVNIPFGEGHWQEKRNVAHEEVCRDLNKFPDQLLIDIHDESLDRTREWGENTCRVLARMASMQLRTQRQLEKQAEIARDLESRITAIGLTIAGISLFFGVIQAVTGLLALCK